MPLILGHLNNHTKFLLPIIIMGFNKDHHFALDSPISFQLFLWLYLQVFLQLYMWLYVWLQTQGLHICIFWKTLLYLLQLQSSRSTYLHFLKNFLLFTITSFLSTTFIFYKFLSILQLLMIVFPWVYNFILHSYNFVLHIFLFHY